jgi:hypothetical protein
MLECEELLKDYTESAAAAASQGPAAVLESDIANFSSILGNSKSFYRELYLDMMFQFTCCSRRVFHRICYSCLAFPFRGGEFCNCGGRHNVKTFYAGDEFGEIIGGRALKMDMPNEEAMVRNLLLTGILDPIVASTYLEGRRKEQLRFKDRRGHRDAIMSMMAVTTATGVWQ